MDPAWEESVDTLVETAVDNDDTLLMRSDEFTVNVDFKVEVMLCTEVIDLSVSDTMELIDALRALVVVPKSV